MWRFGNSTVSGPVSDGSLRPMAEIMAYNSRGKMTIAQAMQQLRNRHGMALDTNYMRPPLPQEGLAYGRASVGHHYNCPWPQRRFSG